MLKRFVVKKNEAAILFRDGDFESILPAGRYHYLDFMGRLKVQTWMLDSALNDVDLANYLRSRAPELTRQYFECIDLNEDEAGLRFEDNILAEVLPPASRRLIWKGAVTHRLEKVALREVMELPAVLVKQLTQTSLRARPILGLHAILMVMVPAYHVGVLKVDGKVERLLSPGVTAYWRFNRDIAVELIDTRLQTMEVSGQEILSSDKVNLRLNLAATWRFTDVLLAHEMLNKPVDHLYRELQFALRAAVGTRSLDALLEDKQAIDEMVGTQLVSKLKGFGIELCSVGVKDIVLPGEMKTILAQVVEAQKSAEANVIRRREETAATRSLLNTAKVMEDNPTALRLKELETLERIAERIDKISVFGGLDQVLNGLVTIGKT